MIREIFGGEESLRIAILDTISKLSKKDEEGVEIDKIAKTLRLGRDKAEELVIELAKERKINIMGGRCFLLLDQSYIVGARIDQEGLPEEAFGQGEAAPGEIDVLKEAIRKKEEEKD